MKNKLEEIIKSVVYSPTSNYSAKLDNSVYCAMSVHEQGRGVGFYQCGKKAIEVIGGYGFCSTHAKEIKHRAGISKIIGTHYVAKFENSDEPSIAEFDFSEKTEKFYTVEEVRNIVGNIYFFTGKQKITSDGNRGFKFFESEENAWVWLQLESDKFYLQMKDGLEKALENKNVISDLVEHKVWDNRK